MFQQIVIVGNLGRDPEMRFTPSGQAVTNFTVATNRRYTTAAGERVDETAWFNVSAWGKQAEACNEYLRKGARVLVEGRLKCNPETGSPRVYTAKGGTPRASFEVEAHKVVFLSTRADDAQDEDREGVYGVEPF